MDWSKAKTILIIGMIIANILLIWAYADKRPVNECLTKEYISETKEILKESGIELCCDIPDKSVKIACPYVAEDFIDSQEINKNFFDSKAKVLAVDEENVVMSSDSETCSISEGKVLLYTNSKPDDEIEDFNEESAKKCAEEFAKSRGVFPEDAEFEHIIFSGNDYRIFYCKEDLISDTEVVIEETQLEFVVSKKGVVRMEKYWINITEEGEYSITFNPVSKSLRSLMGDTTLEGKSIIKISPCCYWDKSEWGRERGRDSVQGVSFPGFRILFSDGEERILTER